ncbi:hypothetical protein AW119_10050 [Escherichia coli]|uniref:hypothetical protein n=1 Tax=Escherichia coli TaxID=562 RepID=UPI000A2E543C|nr:hypothetical protein [Escherichia coli]EFK1740387.1 hypothetical protein [Escherichia coli]OTD38300.1 hypothetical protein AW095_04645 [Escherichia coli]OTE51604.1 hypothetical protein AW119_10050 [Escherichia coli]TJQ47274.1 hypothetical protein C9Z62_12760 [Escherichia coli]
MKSNLKRLVRAYDKCLCHFDDLKNNKRKRRRIARKLAKEWNFGDTKLTADQAYDVVAEDLFG